MIFRLVFSYADFLCLVFDPLSSDLNSLILSHTLSRQLRGFLFSRPPSDYSDVLRSDHLLPILSLDLPVPISFTPRFLKHVTE